MLQIRICIAYIFRKAENPEQQVLHAACNSKQEMHVRNKEWKIGYYLYSVYFSLLMQSWFQVLTWSQK